MDALLFNGSLLRGLQAACIVTGVVRTSALRGMHHGFELSSISLSCSLSLSESISVAADLLCLLCLTLVRLLSLDAWCARISS